MTMSGEMGTMDWSEIGGRGTFQGGIVVNATHRDALLDDLEARLAQGQGFSLATLNLDHLVKFRQQAFRNAYARHSHVTADGNPVVWLLRLAGQRVELIPGADLVAPVAERAAKTGAPVALLGSTEASLARAAEALIARHPDLNVVARIAPPMGFDPEGAGADAAIAELEAAGARLCFLALGAPKQEIFAARAAAALPQTGFLSIGAGLDFLSGAQVRAPQIARALALEWLWRLLRNPGRLARRYAACFAILPRAAWHALQVRQRGS